MHVKRGTGPFMHGTEFLCMVNLSLKALLIATNLTSICCVYKEKIDKDVSYRRT